MGLVLQHWAWVALNEGLAGEWECLQLGPPDEPWGRRGHPLDYGRFEIGFAALGIKVMAWELRGRGWERGSGRGKRKLCTRARLHRLGFHRP